MSLLSEGRTCQFFGKTSFSVTKAPILESYPANIYLFKINNRNKKKCALDSILLRRNKFASEHQIFNECQTSIQCAVITCLMRSRSRITVFQQSCHFSLTFLLLRTDNKPSAHQQSAQRALSIYQVPNRANISAQLSLKCVCLIVRNCYETRKIKL